MSREFAKSEIIRQKCSICGIKNKLFTELVYEDKTIGYKLTCCNCGHVDTFFFNDDHIATHLYGKGREVCIQVTTCKNKKCPYYGKYSLHQASLMIDAILNGKDYNFDNDNNNSSDNNTSNDISFSDTIQLDINGCCKFNPKFH